MVPWPPARPAVIGEHKQKTLGVYLNAVGAMSNLQRARVDGLRAVRFANWLIGFIVRLSNSQKCSGFEIVIYLVKRGRRTREKLLCEGCKRMD